MSTTAVRTGGDIWVDIMTQAVDGDLAAQHTVRERYRSLDWAFVWPRVLKARPEAAPIMRELRNGATPVADIWAENGDAPHAKLYRLIDDLEAESLSPPEWGIADTYPYGGLVLLFGPRGIGKTFAALGWAFAHGATGSWLDRAAKPGAVVYILAEGRGGLSVRVRAQKEHLGLDGFGGVYFITQAVPTLDSCEVDRLIDTIATLPEPPTTIVWDTLSRTFVGGEENSAKDMALYVANVDRVGEATGATRIIIHHSGHGSAERERGSSVLGGAADTIIALREKDGLLELACDKQKDGAEFAPIPLELQTVADSCVLSLHDARGASSDFLSQVEREALRSLHDAFLDDGASTTAWLAASGMAESSFYKARTSLVRREFVAQIGNGRGARYVLTPHAKVLRSLHTSMVTP